MMIPFTCGTPLVQWWVKYMYMLLEILFIVGVRKERKTQLLLRRIAWGKGGTR